MKRWRGFTLLEVLVAVAIFAVIGVAAHALLQQALAAQAASEKQGEKLAEWQRAMWRMEQDFSQIAWRKTRDPFGEPVPYVRGLGSTDAETTFIEFTRTGWRNPAGLPRSQLEHVVYQVQDGVLWRLSWLYPDRAREEADFKRALLHHVKGFKVRFMDDTNQWRNDWANAAGASDVPPPRAVAIDLEFDSGEKIHRLFVISEGSL
ncbi:MAG: type II secretion system protein GspJ [Gammaproteobacteria bacterium]|nr:MAG: type II secretion system protein GspJ [Gammaproteobacteria bacterium]